MDPFTIAMGALKFGIEAVGMAHKAGMLGGSTSFGPYLEDAAALWGNFTTLVDGWRNPDQYDAVNAMEPAAKIAFIYDHVLLEGMDKKNARIRAEMGLGEGV